MDIICGSQRVVLSIALNCGLTFWSILLGYFSWNFCPIWRPVNLHMLKRYILKTPSVSLIYYVSLVHFAVNSSEGLVGSLSMGILYSLLPLPGTLYSLRLLLPVILCRITVRQPLKTIEVDFKKKQNQSSKQLDAFHPHF